MVDFFYVMKSWKSKMNSKELIPITEDWNSPIEKGTLIGFKGLGEEKGITAASGMENNWE